MFAGKLQLFKISCNLPQDRNWNTREKGIEVILQWENKMRVFSNYKYKDSMANTIQSLNTNIEHLEHKDCQPKVKSSLAKCKPIYRYDIRI